MIRQTQRGYDRYILELFGQKFGIHANEQQYLEFVDSVTKNRLDEWMPDLNRKQKLSIADGECPLPAEALAKMDKTIQVWDALFHRLY